MAEGRSAPRVLLFRPMPLDRDTRAKKFAATLARGGFEVIVLSPVSPGADETEQRMGDVRVIPVPLGTRHQDAHNRKLVARRQQQFRVITNEDPDSYVTRVAEIKRALRQTAARTRRLRGSVGASPHGLLGAVKWAVSRSEYTARKAAYKGTRARWSAQANLNKAVVRVWRTYDHRRRDTSLLATDHGVLPELQDYALAFAPYLDRLRPDVIHAHHPFILVTAINAARRHRAAGRACAVVYDARENFAGIPAAEQGSLRRHTAVVRQEVRTIGQMERVMTVSEPIADELHQRYSLPRRPEVILNVPVRVEPGDGPTVRDLAGLAPDVPLLVYSGGVSAARGLETLVEAMGKLPDTHLAVVAVPFPHPSTPALLELAEEVGAADRVHVLPPVDQPRIARYLSGANFAVHPMPGGSPNHDQAMPNKLFEYLHAGLPLVVSDARLMAEFVTRHGVGETFVSHDPASLADAIDRLRAQAPTPQHIAGVAGQYSWQGQEDVILRAYAEVTGWTPRSPEGDRIDLTVREATDDELARVDSAAGKADAQVPGWAPPVPEGEGSDLTVREAEPDESAAADIPTREADA